MSGHGELVRTLTLGSGPNNLVGYSDLVSLVRALEAIEADTIVRAIILTSTGPDFSLGANLRDPELATRIAAGDAERREVAALGQTAVDRFASLRVPTVVSVRGRALGAGACFAATADFVFASEGAQIGFPEVDRGMHLSWGIVPRLVARCGPVLARTLCLVGAPVPIAVLGATTAEDPDAAARDFAARLAAKPPLAVQSIVKVLRSGDASEDAALFAQTVASRDFAEAMSAFFAKRPPTFVGA